MSVLTGFVDFKSVVLFPVNRCPRKFASELILQFLCLALAAAFGVGGSGCGRKADGRVRVVIWHAKSGEEREAFNRLVAGYNASHADRLVEALYHEPEELRNLYIIASVAGQGPDLVHGASDNVGVFEATKTVRALDTILRREHAAQFVDEAFVRYKGQTWLLADQIGNHLALVYDRQKVPVPPKDFTEWIAMAKRLTVVGVAGGRASEYGLTWNYREPYFFIPFLTSFGGWVIDDSGKPTLDNEQTVAALQFILDLRDKHRVIPREGDYEIADMLFKERRTAMIINGPWSWGSYNVPKQSLIAPLPLNNGTGLAMTPMYSPKGYSINASVSDTRISVVLDVLEYLTSREVQQRNAETLLITPTHREVIASDSVRNNAVLEASMRQIRQARPIPIRPEMRQIWDGMRGPYQLIMSGSLSARDGARQMQRECERLIADSQL